MKLQSLHHLGIRLYSLHDFQCSLMSVIISIPADRNVYFTQM
jgi:hypothetical protein